MAPRRLGLAVLVGLTLTVSGQRGLSRAESRGLSRAQSKGPAAPAASRFQFADVTARAGIGFVHKSGASPDKFMVETFGSGVAWIDYDEDGFQDLFFVNGAPGSSNALYHNNRDGTFTDVTARAGVAGNEGLPAEASAKAGSRYKTGVAVGDFDNDGYLDLYVTAFGPNTLYRNNRDGTFKDVTSAAGVASTTGSPTIRTAATPSPAIACTATRRCSTGWRTGCIATTATARSPTSRSRPASPIRPARVSAWRSAITTATA
jgi:hypothetical protein